MTSGQQDRRALVAESYRYARAFYDGAEATGPAAFEGNRQAIIDVLALAYRDGTAAAVREDERTEMVKKAIAMGMHEPADCPGESALRAAAHELVRQVILSNALDDHGHPLRNLQALADVEAALDGAPWEPSEEMVERVVEVMIDSAEETDLSEFPDEARRFARAALKAAMGSDTST